VLKKNLAKSALYNSVIYMPAFDILSSGKIEYAIGTLEICVVPLKYST